MKIAWNKIGLIICILILIAMLVAWALFASYCYCGYYSEILNKDIEDFKILLIQNATLGFLFYVLPILLVLKNLKLLIEIYKTGRSITKKDMYSIMSIVIPLYILFILILYFN